MSETAAAEGIVFDSLLCARNISIDNRRNLGPDDSACKTLDMIGAHSAGADNTYSEFGWNRIRTSFLTPYLRFEGHLDGLKQAC